MKRFFDLFASIIALAMFTPILLAVSSAIAITCGAPVLFKQERVGLHGRLFKILKFRTMHHSRTAGSGSFDAGSSARVTGIGRFLRKTKLDELPQLLNVILGDMSIVGPRPEIEKWTRVFPDRWKIVHTVRPGITDPASIKFRNEEEILSLSKDPEKTYRTEILPMKLNLYEQYVYERSFGKDLLIISKTIMAITK